MHGHFGVERSFAGSLVTPIDDYEIPLSDFTCLKVGQVQCIYYFFPTDNPYVEKYAIYTSRNF